MGKRLLSWCKRANLWWLYVSLKYLLPAALTGVAAWVSAERTTWSVVAFIVAILLNYLWVYLADCERGTIRDNARELNADMAGNVSAVIRSIQSRFDKSIKPTAFVERCVGLQQNFLTYIVDVASESLAVRRETVSANWMVLTDHNSLVLEVFDRNVVGRQVIDLSLDGHQAGAVVAFKSQDVTVVPDTHDEPVRHMFRANCPYRAIISIPVTVDQVVVGVVNIDSTVPHSLPIDLADELLDAVYLIGLVEVLKDGSRP